MALSEPRIVCAANEISFLDQQGQVCKIVVAGARHHDSVMNPVIRRLMGDDAELPGRENYLNSEQGFIDQHGRFYSRQAAWQIAQRQNQIARRVGGDETDGGTLFSENLY
jgi:hypothetical protein